MPELPEVETVARQLKPLIKGKIVNEIVALDPKLKSNSFKKLVGLKVKDVYRVGKQVILEFDREKYLAIHLRMTGRLISADINKKTKLADFYHNISINQKHIRFKLMFDKRELNFVDPRRFGTVKLLSEIEQVGVDPVSNSFSKKLLAELINNNAQPLKNWLMRQDRLVGIGNIYASEILFDSKLNPQRKINTLSLSQIDQLYLSIRKILNKAIKNCGTTFSDFQTTTGEVGSFQNFLKVYGREGESCLNCQAGIKRIVQQQRSTFFCNKCQK